MQPHDDFRNDDAPVRDLLREWQAPATPQALEQRVLASHQLPSQQAPPQQAPPQHIWWRFLLRGYIRVPVPLACCAAVLILLAAWRSVRPEGAGAPCSIAEQHSIIEQHSIMEQPAVCTSAIPDAC